MTQLISRAVREIILANDPRFNTLVDYLLSRKIDNIYPMDSLLSMHPEYEGEDYQSYCYGLYVYDKKRIFINHQLILRHKQSIAATIIHELKHAENDILGILADPVHDEISAIQEENFFQHRDIAKCRVATRSMYNKVKEDLF